MRFFPIIILGIVVVASVSSLRAQETEIPPVTVYGELDSASRDLTASTTIIKTADYQNRIVSVPEILSEQAGVHITRFGGLEDATSISIRGSTADEVLVLLDGIPLNAAEGGGVDLSPFLLESLDSIEVYRGSGPIQYGFAPVAGTVALNSRPIEGHKSSASVGYGSFNTFRTNLFHSDKWKRFGFITSFALLRTDGDFSFLDDNGTPANPHDDQTVKRQNNQSQTIHPFFKLEYDFDEKTKLEWVSHIIRKDNGVPGLSTNQSEGANLDTTSWLTSLKVRRDSFFHKNLAFENRAYLHLNKSQYADPLGEIGLGTAQDTDNDTSLFGNQTTFEFLPHPNQLITAFILYQVERFRPEDFAATPSQGGTSVRQQWNIGAGDEIELLNRRLLVHPAVLLENVYNRLNNDDPSFLTPAVFSNTKNQHEVTGKLGLKGVATSFLTLQANASRGVRFPTFPELFGDRGTVVGNPALKAEESINWDAGMALRVPPPDNFKADLNIFYFDRRVDDLIQFEQQVGFARAENIGRARVQGVEAQGNLTAFNHMNLSANYTFQDAKNEADHPGNQLPGRPRHEVDARMEGYIERGKVFVGMNWIDSNFLDPLNTRIVRDRIILNAGLSFKPVKKMTFVFEGKNLTNDQIVDVVGFPLPGRSFFGRVDFTL